MLPDLNAGAATSTAGTRTRFGFAAESLPFIETVHPTITKQIVEDGKIHTSRATCRPTTNSLPEGFGADAPLDHLVEELWSSAVDCIQGRISVSTYISNCEWCGESIAGIT